MFREALNIDSKCFALTNLESALLALLWVNAKILDDLVVDLANLSFDLVANIRISVLADAIENLYTSLRYNAFVCTITGHGVRLA